MTDLALPPLEFTVVTNGIPERPSVEYLREGTRFHVKQVFVSGDSVFKSQATLIQLRLDDVQLIVRDLITGIASLTVDGALVGDPQPWSCYINDTIRAEGPTGILNWRKRVAINWNDPDAGYFAFGLLIRPMSFDPANG